MTAKEYLERIEALDNRINEKMQELGQLRSLTIPGSPVLDDLGNTGWSGDRIGNLVAKITDMEAEIDSMIDEFYNMKCVAKKYMFDMQNRKYYEILCEHYFHHKSIYQIAKENNMDYRSTKKLHWRALSSFQKILDIVYKSE